MLSSPDLTPNHDEKTITVDVCIVTYRTAELVIRCLRSLLREREVAQAAGIQLRLVVVDNASGDAPALERFVAEAAAGDFTHVLRAERNGGFAYGNNVAFKFAYDSGKIPDYFWLLNPDTEALPRSSVELVAFMKTRPRVGVAGSRLQYENGVPWPYAFRFPTPLSEIDSGLKLGLLAKYLEKAVVLRKMGERVEEVDWLPGASMLVRRELIEAIGGMDERYFLYYEETDYCRRIREAGYTIVYVPASRVMHIAGGSTGVTAKVDRPKRLPGYWFESRRRYFQKNFGLPYAIAADALFVGATCLGNLKHVLKGERDQIVPHQVRDVLSHSPLLPKNRELPPAQAFHPTVPPPH
jgi:N-acetylglucosaminyl-diphospho-decaprenol L-rhamnosyltransferase